MMNNIDIDELLNNDIKAFNINTNNISFNNKFNNNIDTKQYQNIVFTDGACTMRSKNNIKKGGFGIFIDNNTKYTFLKNLKLYKKFNKVEFCINESLILTDTTQKFTYDVTNIRAEGYAILYTLIIFDNIINNKISNKDDLLEKLSSCDIFPFSDFKKEINICKNCKSNDILIVTDSEFWIKTITIWSKNWYKNDIILEKANVDIVLYIMYYYNKLLNNNINVEFKHVKGHSDKNKNKDFSYYELGNIEVDKLALKGKNSDDYLFHII